MVHFGTVANEVPSGAPWRGFFQTKIMHSNKSRMLFLCVHFCLFFECRCMFFGVQVFGFFGVHVFYLIAGVVSGPVPMDGDI